MAKFRSVITDFDENYDSEGESIFSNISCLSKEKLKEVQKIIEPLTPVLINTDENRPRVSSIDNSVHSASPSINTFKMISSTITGESANPVMTVLSKVS